MLLGFGRKILGYSELYNPVTTGFGRKILGYSVLYNPVTTV